MSLLRVRDGPISALVRPVGLTRAEIDPSRTLSNDICIYYQQGRIQDSEFRTGISGADPNCCRVLGKSTSKKKLQTAVGGGVRSPPKKTCIRA